MRAPGSPRRAALALLTAAAVGGCGRFGFDGTGGGNDARGGGDGGGVGGDGGSPDGLPVADAPVSPFQSPTLGRVDFIGGEGGQSVMSVASDAAGNIVVVGYARDRSIEVEGLLIGDVGRTDLSAWIVRFAADGGATWWDDATGMGDERMWGVAADSQGNWYGCGSYTSDQIEFGVSADVPGGGENGFVVSWDPAGNVRWVRAFGGNADDYCFGIAVGPDTDGVESVHFTGWVTDTATFNGQMSTTTAGGQDAVYGIVSLTGDVLKFDSYGGVGGDQGQGIAVSPTKNFAIVGQFSETAAFPSNTVAADGGIDGFAYLSTPNAGADAIAAHGPDTERLVDVDLDNADRAAYVGSFGNTVAFGQSAAVTTNGGRDGLFVTSEPGIDSVATFGSAFDDDANAVTFLPGGRYLVVGRYTHASNATGEILQQTVVDRGTAADGLAFIAEDAGTLLWFEFIGGNTFDTMIDAARTPSGFVTVGEFASFFDYAGFNFSPAASDIMILRWQLP